MPFYKVPSTSTADLQRTAVTGSRSPQSSTTDVSMFPTDYSDGSLTELSEVDQNSVLQRRALDQQVLMSQWQHGLVQKNGVNHTSSMNDNQHRAKSAIELELIAQHHREKELAEMRLLLSPAGSSSSWSVDSEAMSNGCGDGTDPLPTAQVNDESPLYTDARENRIVRELRDQQQREIELRGRWKEMGLAVLEEDNNHNETPFTLPQPVQDKQRESGKTQSKATTSVNNQPASGSHNLPDGNTKTSVQFQSHVNSNNVEDDESGMIDQDNGVSRRFVYTPEAETPIEREIRIARDREQALRLERGLPSGSTDELDNRRRFDPEVEQSFDNNSQSQIGGSVSRQAAESNDKVTMKKLANGRLQMELNKEKQRELELKSRGMIHTTSEDRVGKTVKYVDIITERNVGGNSPLELPRNFRVSERASVSASPSSEEVKISSVAPSIGHQICDGRSNGSRNVSKSVDITSSEAPELLQRFAEKSSNFSDGSGGAGNALKCKPGSRPSATENKILRELQEMHRREEELRLHQRSTDYSDVPEDESEHGSDGLNRNYSPASLADDDVTKGSRSNKDSPPIQQQQQRNRNVLIAQWETKVEQS